MSKMKIIVLIVIVVAIMLIGLFFYFALPDKNADVNYTVSQVSSKDGQSKLYIKKKVWGMTSDNQVIVISNSNEKEFTPKRAENYVYEGIMPLFYKIQEDTLTIYTLKISAVPSNLKTRLKIIQVQLENPEMMKLIEHDHYKTQGLTEIN